MAFRVGQKVVCVDDGPARWAADAPVKGAVYTVRGFKNAIYAPFEPGLLLCEIKNVVHRDIIDDDACYLSRRFRPVVERKTDISIFTKMLTGEHVNA